MELLLVIAAILGVEESDVETADAKRSPYFTLSDAYDVAENCHAVQEYNSYMISRGLSPSTGKRLRKVA